MSRRESLKRLTGAIVAATIPACVGFAPRPVLAEETQPVATDEQQAAMRQLVVTFMNRFRVPGFSLAIARHGQMVYQQGFGLADTAQAEKVTPSHRFRIASVTKPLTSTAIFTLIEKGRLRLGDTAFGAGGILGFDYGATYPDRVQKITIDHLLIHTCGGWSNEHNDPMFFDATMETKDLIRFTVQKVPLENAPGTKFAYSNFGYCLLGRVVEKLSGQGYAEFVQQNVLAPCGIANMRIAGNKLSERAPDEVVYYEPGPDDPYLYNIARMDSHGGWIATPADLVRFAVRVDGFPQPPDLLRPETLKTMMTPSAVSGNYARGWYVNNVPNWWHAGALPGTATILVRTASGLCWAGFANTRLPIEALDQTIWNVVKAVPSWRA